MEYVSTTTGRERRWRAFSNAPGRSAHDFLNRRQPSPNLVQPVLTQRLETFLSGLLTEKVGRRPLQDEGLKSFRNRQDFEQPDTSAIPGRMTGWTPLPTCRHHLVRFFFGESYLHQLIRWNGIRLLAQYTHLPHQPLRDNQTKRGCHHKRFNPHVQQSRDRSNRVASMKR